MDVANNGTGTVDNLIGETISLSSPGAANAYGLKIATVGTNYTGLGNNYGVYIQDQSQSGATGDNFNLYSQGPGLNYFGGNVGIGTTSPATALDTVGQIDATSYGIDSQSGSIISESRGTLRFGNAGSSVNESTALVAGGTVGAILLLNGNFGIGNINPQYTLDITGISGTSSPFNVASSSGTSELMVSNQGNVGIGTTSPNQALQVVGSISNIITTAVHPNYPNCHYNRRIPDPWSIYVSGRYAYTANVGSDNISIVDISNPSSPVQIGSAERGICSCCSLRLRPLRLCGKF